MTKRIGPEYDSEDTATEATVEVSRLERHARAGEADRVTPLHSEASSDGARLSPPRTVSIVSTRELQRSAEVPQGKRFRNSCREEDRLPGSGLTFESVTKDILAGMTERERADWAIRFLIAAVAERAVRLANDPTAHPQHAADEARDVLAALRKVQRFIAPTHRPLNDNKQGGR